MKILIIIFFFPILLMSQDKIDPLPIITDTTSNYDIIDPVQHDFFLGWNWGTPGKKLDDALYMNIYHGYPTAGSINNDDYADNIRIVQQLKGNTIGGRPDTTIFNSQSLYLEPTIKVIHPDGPIQFQPTLRNQNGAVFGFMNKSGEIKYKNDPMNPDFGKVFLYKDSITALPKVVLDDIWSNNILRFYNYSGKPILDSVSMNGKELFVSINLKSLEPITPLNKDDIVLTIKLPYKVWNDTINNKAGGYVSTNNVKFKNLPKVSGFITDDTIQIHDSRGDFRGIRRDTNVALSSTPGIREFQITGAMLDALGNGTPNNNITLAAFTTLDTFKLFGNHIWNPIFKPDWHGHGKFIEYINDLDVEVTYHGNLDVAIDWIRLETPRARDIFDGKYDHNIYSAAKAMMDEIAAETIHHPKLYKFYAADELLPHQWGLNRYYNLLVDTLAATETTLSKNSPAHFLHSTLFKEYWTGDNLRFLNEQATPSIRNTILRDSALSLSGSDTLMYSESLESLNYKFGFKGYYRRNTSLNNTVNEWYDYPLLDTMVSDYETFIDGGDSTHQTLPFPANNWPYDSISGTVVGGHEFYHSSTQFQIEFKLNSYYRKQERMLFDKTPWWANLWVISETWKKYYLANGDSTYSVDKPGHRPKTGEEIRLMATMPTILGAKGLLYWFKTEHSSGNALGMQNHNKLDSLSQFNLPSGEELIYSNEIGGDFIQTNDPFKRLDSIDRTKLRLDKFDHDSNRVYIGIKSLRAEVYKLHKWINAVDDELMDLRLQAWHGKGYKEWEEWNQYNSYQHWEDSPLRRLVNVDSIRTSKIFEPKARGSRPHNYNPGFESRDSSFFDITLLQDLKDSPKDLFNRKKSIYLGIQNRRTDPLIYRDSDFYEPPGGYEPPPLLPSDWHGELMFFSSAEMDSNVRFGGKDLWDVNMSASWWKTQWWRRLGARELRIPINIPVYGNGTYLVAEELGLEKLDTLGWWYDDELYHKVDTSLADGDNLLAKLLPGQGKIIKFTYVPYFFNDPTDDSDSTNDHCYFCDIFNDFDLFDFEVTLVDTTLEESCCYDISFTYTGDCTFEDIPFRLIIEGDTGNDFSGSEPIYALSDSVGTNIKYRNILMDLDSNTGTVNLGRYCVSDDENEYRISFLAGKDKGTRFIGCDRELQFQTECGEIDSPRDCCENLAVSDSMYSTGGGGNFPPTDFCTILSIDTGFDSDCIYGVRLGDGNVQRTLIEMGINPIDFTTGGGFEFTLCYGLANCAPGSEENQIQMVTMQFLGKDGTVVCEIEVPIWMPCTGGLGALELDLSGPATTKTIKERKDSKTYKSESFDVTIWPNPTSGELNVEINSKVDTEVDIRLANNIGVGLSNENGVQLNKGKNERLYNLNSYSSGVYYLQINGKDGNIVLPIILNK